jgi:hypothetical protein
MNGPVNYNQTAGKKKGGFFQKNGFFDESGPRGEGGFDREAPPVYDEREALRL